MQNLRRARDQEEFDRFKADRDRARPAQPDQGRSEGPVIDL